MYAKEIVSCVCACARDFFASKSTFVTENLLLIQFAGTVAIVVFSSLLFPTIHLLRYSNEILEWLEFQHLQSAIQIVLLGKKTNKQINESIKTFANLYKIEWYPLLCESEYFSFRFVLHFHWKLFCLCSCSRVHIMWAGTMHIHTSIVGGTKLEKIERYLLITWFQIKLRFINFKREEE